MGWGVDPESVLAMKNNRRILGQQLPLMTPYGYEWKPVIPTVCAKHPVKAPSILATRPVKPVKQWIKKEQKSVPHAHLQREPFRGQYHNRTLSTAPRTVPRDADQRFGNPGLLHYSTTVHAHLSGRTFPCLSNGKGRRKQTVCERVMILCAESER